MTDIAQSETSAKSSLPLIDRKLLELLVCPKTKAPLTFDEKAMELISDKARLAYPVRDGVPILLISEGRPLDD